MAGHARDSGRSVRRRLEGSFNAAAAAEEHGTNSCQSMAAASSKKSLAESLDLNPDATPSPKKPASKRQKRRHSTEAPSKERASVPVVMSSPGCVCVYIYIYIFFFYMCVCLC